MERLRVPVQVATSHGGNDGEEHKHTEKPLMPVSDRLVRVLHGGKWQNFASGIATGAAYVVLSGIHWKHKWLDILGTVLFLLNCTIFTVNFILIFTSAYLKGNNLIRQLTDPSTALVIPLVIVDFATICVGIYLYSHRLGNFDPAKYPMEYIGVFWTYFAFSMLTSIPVTVGWFGSVGKSHELSTFSLTGCFLVFPLMLVGTVAINALAVIPPENGQTLAILIVGYIMQGIGFSVATAFIIVSQYRAIRYGFHRGASAASGFIACGPFGFTAVVLLRLGVHGQQIWPLHTALTQTAADVMLYAVLPAVFFLVGLALYFWIFNLIPWSVAWKAHLRLNPAGSWTMIFPLAGLNLTFSALGDLLQAPAFWILQVIHGGILLTFYVVIFSCWLYRLVHPADAKVKEARLQAWNQEQLSFWSSWREAELAERRYREHSARHTPEPM